MARPGGSPWRSIRLGRAADRMASLGGFQQRIPISVSRVLSAPAGKADGVGYDVPIDDRILQASLPFVPQTGFTATSLMAGLQSLPELAPLSIKSHTLAGLFPSGNKHFGQRPTEAIGPIKALASCWFDDGNLQMKRLLFSEGLTLEKHGTNGLRRAFEFRLQYNRSIPRDDLLEALMLTLTPAEPFFGIPLPFEPPHILPYASHTLDVSAAALAGLKDHSLSREWMLRRIRMATVYGAIELSTLQESGVSEPTWVISDRLSSLLEASESASRTMGETFDFLVYVNRSSQAIARSLGLLR